MVLCYQVSWLVRLRIRYFLLGYAMNVRLRMRIVQLAESCRAGDEPDTPICKDNRVFRSLVLYNPGLLGCCGMGFGWTLRTCGAASVLCQFYFLRFPGKDMENMQKLARDNLFQSDDSAESSCDDDDHADSAFSTSASEKVCCYAWLVIFWQLFLFLGLLMLINLKSRLELKSTVSVHSDKQQIVRLLHLLCSANEILDFMVQYLYLSALL